MTLEQLKDRKDEFISTMRKYKEYKSTLEERDSMWKKIFTECRPFDDFSWIFFEFSVENYAQEFFHDFLDKDSILQEVLYFIYDLDWGNKIKLL